MEIQYAHGPTRPKPLGAHSTMHCVHAPSPPFTPARAEANKTSYLAEPLAFALETGEWHDNDDAYLAFVANFGVFALRHSSSSLPYDFFDPSQASLTTLTIYSFTCGLVASSTPFSSLTPVIVDRRASQCPTRAIGEAS